MQMHKDRTGRSENMTKVRQGKIAEQNEPDWEECYTCDGEGVSREHCNDGCDNGAVILWDECESCDFSTGFLFVEPPEECEECNGRGKMPRLGECEHCWYGKAYLPCSICNGYGGVCHTCRVQPCNCPS